MKQPSLVIHSHDVPGYKYRMKWTWEAMPKVSAQDIVNWILYVNDRAQRTLNQRLENVILNCHGLSGSLYIGGSASPPISLTNVNLFSQLTACNIDTIWLVACEVANQQGVKSGGIGKAFCSALAKATGANVIASAVNQHVNATFYLRGCPFGCIDDYEGLTYRFLPNGNHMYFVS